MRHFTKWALAAGLLVVPGVAAAEDPSRALRVSAHVPEYCDIHASPILAASGDGIVTGSVFESCNTRDGFQIVASHRPLETDEWVAIEYAGEVRYLNVSGWSQVANRSGARHGLRPVSVRYTSLAAPLAINLTVTMF